jgi:hypothetical protein
MSTGKTGLDTRPIHVGFIVDKAVAGQISLAICRVFPISIVSSVFHTHLDSFYCSPFDALVLQVVSLFQFFSPKQCVTIFCPMHGTCSVQLSSLSFSRLSSLKRNKIHSFIHTNSLTCLLLSRSP